MELAAEDALRLNVLLANELHAVRIDESSMVVAALSEQGEAQVRLNPTGRHDKYLRKVRELISSQVLGSPGGYPVYLRRWTRMGQARDDSLEALLKLGEPEAVVAAVHAPGLTDELARRAWWALPEADNARRMLERSCVVQGAMGPVLAEFLLDYLPFETEHKDMIDSVRLMLQPGLIDEAAKAKLWSMGRRKNSYYVGFLAAIPDELPEPVPAHPDWYGLRGRLEPLIASGNEVARQLARTLAEPGQAFLKTVHAVLSKPNNQDVVVMLLDAVHAYFEPARPRVEPLPEDMTAGLALAAELCEGDGRDERAPLGLAETLQAIPEFREGLKAMLVLGCTSNRSVTPVFARTDAIGSLMRRKLEPVTTPLFAELNRLRGAPE